MTVEVATYITNLQATNPPSSDPRAQGDDHIRLIKSVLQNTFPSASKALYIPKAEAVSAGPMVLDATDQNNIVTIDTTSADIAVTLPSGLGVGDGGWSCEIVKTTPDTHGVMVTPASGSIFSRVGVTASIRVGAYFEPARFVWTGTFWLCVKPGMMIGATVNWDAAAIPPGFLALDGTVFSSTTFAELAAAYATTTLKDKRGRADIGSGTGAGLTTRSLGTNYGQETVALGLTHLPPQTPSGTISGSVSGTVPMTTQANNVGTLAGFTDIISGGTTAISASFSGTFTGNAMPGQNSTPFVLLQPSVATQKLVRAC